MAFSANTPAVNIPIRATDKTKQAFTSVNSSLDRLGGRLKIVGTLLGGVAIAKSVRTWVEFEKSISDLSAITGATGEQLAFLTKKAREMGAVTTLSATQAAEAFKLVASGKPELLESSEALAAVTRQTVLLAEAASIEMPEAANALTAALNQYGRGAEDANRFINVLAAGSKFGASEIALTSEALEKVGTVAAIAGISFEELNANIQGLAGVALKGSDAGTALRNAILKLQDQANPKFNPAIVGLTQAFKNLKDSGIGTVEIMGLVGLRTISATQALMKQADSLDTLEKKITGTTVAEEQAAIRTDNLKGDVKRLEAAYEDLSIEIVEMFNPAMRAATQELTEFLLEAVHGPTALEEFLVYGITAWNRGFLTLGASIAETVSKMELFSAKVTFGDLSDRHLAKAREAQAQATKLWQRAAFEQEIQLQLVEAREERLRLLTPDEEGNTPRDKKKEEERLARLRENEEKRLALEKELADARAEKLAEDAAKELLKKKENAQNELWTIQQSLMTKEQMEGVAFVNRMAVLEENRELELIGQETYDNLKLGLEQEYLDNLEKIKKKKDEDEKKRIKKHTDYELKMREQVAGQALGIMRTLGAKSKAFAIAAIAIEAAIAAKKIFIETQVAAAAALVPPPIGLGPVAGIPLAAAIKTMGVVSAGMTLGAAALEIGSLGDSGGSSSVKGTGAFGSTRVTNIDPVTGVPERSEDRVPKESTEVTINFGNQALFTTDQVRSLIEEINEQIEDGVHVAAIKVA